MMEAVSSNPNSLRGQRNNIQGHIGILTGSIQQLNVEKINLRAYPGNKSTVLDHFTDDTKRLDTNEI
jgi:hypothetical protein